MLLNWLSSDLVVHQCRYIVLERGSELVDNGLVGTFLTLFFQNDVHLDNLLVGICEIVFGAHRA